MWSVMSQIAPRCVQSICCKRLLYRTYIRNVHRSRVTYYGGFWTLHIRKKINISSSGLRHLFFCSLHSTCLNVIFQLHFLAESLYIYIYTSEHVCDARRSLSGIGISECFSTYTLWRKDWDVWKKEHQFLPEKHPKQIRRAARQIIWK